MPISLEEVTFDADLGQAFTILRTTGKFGAGGWVAQDPPQNIPAFGVIAIASDKDMQMFPEGDRLTGSLIVISNTPMFTSSENLGIIADQIDWRGNRYKVSSLGRWSDFGFHAVLMVRKTGS